MKHRHLWCIQLTCSVVNCVNLNYFLRTHSYLSFKVPVRVCACIFFVVFFFNLGTRQHCTGALQLLPVVATVLLCSGALWKGHEDRIKLFLKFLIAIVCPLA